MKKYLRKINPIYLAPLVIVLAMFDYTQHIIVALITHKDMANLNGYGVAVGSQFTALIWFVNYKKAMDSEKSTFESMKELAEEIGKRHADMYDMQKKMAMMQQKLVEYERMLHIKETDRDGKTPLASLKDILTSTLTKK